MTPSTAYGKSGAPCFQPLDVSLNDNFFLDLGGHSLLAARMVSELRHDSKKDANFASLTMRDVYAYPTISQLASAIDTSQAAESPHLSSPKTGDRNAGRRHFLAGVIQSASLYLVFAFRGVQWIAPWLIYFLLAPRHSVLDSIAWAAASGIAVLPSSSLLQSAPNGPCSAASSQGASPCGAAYYLRWWFVQTLVRSVPLTRLGGTPLLPFVYRLFGAKVAEQRAHRDRPSCSVRRDFDRRWREHR